MYPNESNELEFARNTILVNQFCKIVTLCGDDCPIVPIKGISLLFTIYKDNYARNMADIDFLVAEKNVPRLVEKLESIGYRFRKNHNNLKTRLNLKHKFDMVNVNNRFCDLDIHTGLINEKFVQDTSENFTDFTISRLQTRTYNNLKLFFLNPVDEWIYLAQHYCFHFFSRDKWLHDLYLIQAGFSNSDITELITISQKFHFERIVTVASLKLRQQYGIETIKIPPLISKWHSLNFILSYKPQNKFAHKMVIIHRRSLFIDNKKTRNKAYLKLFIPKLNYLSDTYHCNKFVAFLLIPIHLLLSLLSLLSFWLIYVSYRTPYQRFQRI